jgi:sulfotransferase family protein
MLPDILIVGAQKAGTSTIFESLATHPDVQPARDPKSGESLKEVHFFDNGWGHGPQWYGAHYVAHERRGIDATPNYLAFLHAHPRMRETVPDARLVVSLRDPVERAYSQYNHYKQDLPRSRTWDWIAPDGDFTENVRAELDRNAPLDPRYRGLVARGYYIDQLESLLRYYPREQMHVMVMEQWTKRPKAAMDELLRFLRLANAEVPVDTAHGRDYSVEPIEPETRRLLHAVYEMPNQRLFSFLGQPIEEWSRRSG